VRRPKRGPRATGIALLALLTLVTVAVWLASRPRSAAERLEAARAIAAGLSVTAVVEDSGLVGGRAIADFGLGHEVALVRVRIVDRLRLTVRFGSAAEVSFAEPPRLCLVGPYSAPDDAGLSDPCWGEPDLGDALAARLPTDPAGRPMLAAGLPVEVAVDLRRGDVRCDYAPGAWWLDVAVDPIVDGSPAEPIDLAPVALEVPFSPDDTVVEAPGARYCGLAETIVRQQGEPSFVPG
jgi:hypothetical protein